jgi:hypothetical protein
MARWPRLKQALGTSSSDFVNASLLFVNASLLQLQQAAQLHCGGISEVAMNAALALIEAAAHKMKSRELSRSRWRARTPPVCRFSLGSEVVVEVSGE